MSLNHLLERARNIKLVTMDVDGVMTDGKIYFTDDGKEFKAFNILDGQGVKMMIQAGLKTAVITGRTSTIVEKRMNNLGIHYLRQGREDKIEALAEILEEDGQGISFDQICHIGDDYPDLTIFNQAGLCIAPANAHPVVKEQADGITTLKGGEGAVREMADLLVQAQGKFEALTRPWIEGKAL